MKNRVKKVSELSEDELVIRREKERTRKAVLRAKTYVPPTKRENHRYAGNEQFIGIDGEGVDTEDGEQHYAMLVASTGEYIIDPEGLSSLQCFHFLAQLAFKYPKAILVCYGASYDVNMMLKDIPRKLLQELHGYTDKSGVHDASDITWNGYRIKYRARKEFWLGLFAEPKFVENKRTGKMRPNYQCTVRLWDVIGFYQGAFIKSVQSYLGDHPLLEMIKKGKLARGNFSREQLETFVLPYCQAEVQVLVELMNVLRDNLQAADLRISRWDGAGACAMALLKRENVKDHMARFDNDIHIAAQFAYAGGRIELQWYGNYEKKGEKIYHYDLRSAYPAAMLELYSLDGAMWKHISERIQFSSNEKLPHTAMFRVEWSFDDKKSFYPFAYREHTGSIRFPRKGHNWVWSPELQVALDFKEYFGGSMIIHEAYILVPKDDTIRPFAFLTDLYEQRKIWKKQGNGAEKAMKLAINSLYGKQVQHVGYHNSHDEHLSNLPPFHQLEWGGEVTSRTRAALLRAAMQCPENVICFATDGIFSTKELDLDCSDKLGNWEAATHEYMTIVQSGVYWLESNGKEAAYYRGFDQGAITREKVLAAWKEKKTLLEVECSRFVTLGTALSSDNQFSKWRTWLHADWTTPENRDGKRLLQLSPTGTKRYAEENSHTKSPQKALVKTYPAHATYYEMGIEQMSMKYKLPWEQDGIDEEKEIERENTESFY